MKASAPQREMRYGNNRSDRGDITLGIEPCVFSLGEVIAGKYRITNPRRTEGIFSIYHAEDDTTGAACSLIALTPPLASRRPEDAIRFTAAVEKCKEILHPNILRIIDSGISGEIPFIVVASLVGESLSSFLNAERPTLGQSLEFARQMASALSVLHHGGIVSRGIPACSIFIERNGPRLSVALGGAGFSAVIDLNEVPMELTAEVFSYLPPEIIGMIKRVTDERSDLYSIGVILYQLFTGRLPFESNDVGTLIHQHAAVMPESPSAIHRGIPDHLGTIVLRLLEKDPSQRYQTAAGLLADIERFLRGERNYTLGECDVASRLTFQTSLIGREHEMQRLESLFDNAQQGKGSVCFIGGEAGMGKTRLAAEFRSRVYARGGVHISGKCFPGSDKTPYGPFREALDLYVRGFAKYPAGRRERIREIVKSRVGNLAQVALSLNPTLVDIVGEGEPVPPLDPGRDNERFIAVAVSLLAAIGEADGGLVIQIDDCQWADDGTIVLLKEIARGASRYCLMAIGTFRDNEMSPDHPLAELISIAASDAGCVVMSLPLLDQLQTETLVAAVLNDKAAASALASFIHEKSRGNPFFAIEILKQLIGEETIRRGEGGWEIDRGKLQMIEISPSLIDIILRRINTAESEVRSILSIASIIGNPFETELLFEVAGVSERETVRAIDRGKHLQFIDDYPPVRGCMIFIHDRIREAFYASLDPERRKEIHLAVASALEARYRRGDAEVIYDLAYHYNAAGDPGNTLNYSYPAAMRAREVYAYEEAIRYLRRTIELLEQTGWQGGTLWVDCMEQLGDLLTITNAADEALEVLARIMPLVTESLRKAGLFRIMSEAYRRKGDLKNAEQAAARGLRILGENPPRRRLMVLLGIIKENIIRGAHTLFGLSIFRIRKPAEDDLHHLIIQFYQLLNELYATRDFPKYRYSVLRRLNCAERYLGASGVPAAAHAEAGMLYAFLGRYRRSAAHCSRAIALASRTIDEPAEAKSREAEGHRLELMGRYEAARQAYQLSLAIRERIGDFYEMGRILSGIVRTHLDEGSYDSAIRANDRLRAIAERAGDRLSLIMADIHYARIWRERGDAAKSETHARRALEASKASGLILVSCRALLELGTIAFEQSDFSSATEHLNEAKHLLEIHRFPASCLAPVQIALASALIQDLQAHESRLPARERNRIIRSIRRACCRGLRLSGKLPACRCAALLAAADYQAAVGRDKRSTRLFGESIETARHHGRKFDIALACFRYGLFLQKSGKWEATQHLETSLRIFQEIGASSYLRRAAVALGLEIDQFDTHRVIDRRRLKSVIEVSHDISSTLDPDILLELIMKKAVEVTGAQRGYLFLADENGALHLKASHNVLGADWGGYSRELVEHVYCERAGLIAQDAENEAFFTRFKEVTQSRLKSILCLPIMHRQKVTGVCYLDNPIAAGVFSEEDMEVIQALMTQGAISLENALLVRDLESRVRDRTIELQKARDALWAEINVAQEIQTVLLPENPHITGYQVASWMKPAEMVGGDYFDVINTDVGVDWIVIGDVSGHGVPSGMVMLMVQTAVRSEIYRNPGIRPRELLDNVNRTISYNLALLEARDPRRLRKYMTINALSIAGETITFSGQHEHILLFRTRANKVTILETDGIWLGFEWNHLRNVKDFRFTVEPGDVILLYTDGITDATDPDERPLGIDGLSEIFHSLAPLPVREIKTGLIERLKKYTSRDDMAFVVFKREGPRT